MGLRIRGLRHKAMSSHSKRVVQILPSNRNRRDLHHHMLVLLHPKTKVSIMVGVYNPLDLDAPSVKVMRRKEVTGLLHVLGIVQPTQESIIMAKQVASSMDKRVTS